MARMFRMVPIGILGAAIYLSAQAEPQNNQISSCKTTVILGTCGWDVESGNKASSIDTMDFWWVPGDTERYLVPTNGAQAKLVSGADFGKITPGFIEQQSLSPEKISGSNNGGVLTPGAIVVFKTRKGNLGKFQVEKYRAMHDFSFPEAAQIPERAKSFLLKKPNIEKYHLQVRWQLFR
jgi:hypothetical protein